MRRDELGLITAGAFSTASLVLCWAGHFFIACLFVAGVGGALAVAAEYRK